MRYVYASIDWIVHPCRMLPAGTAILVLAQLVCVGNVPNDRVQVLDEGFCALPSADPFKPPPDGVLIQGAFAGINDRILDTPFQRPIGRLEQVGDRPVINDVHARAGQYVEDFPVRG